VCSVCKKVGREIKGLVPIILRARPERWVSLRSCTVLTVPESALSVIPTLACTRGLGALKPGSSGLSQIYEDIGGPSVPARDITL